MRRLLFAASILVSVFIIGLLWNTSRTATRIAHDHAIFESEIRAYEAVDQQWTPEPGGVVFVGSSSIRLWTTLGTDMAPLNAINRGFGGAELTHLIYNLHRIVIPYKPKAVVVYGGDNDLADGSSKTPEVVLADYKRLVNIVQQSLPSTHVFFLSIKPSPIRWEQWSEMKKANALIREWTDHHPHLHFIDVASALLNADGRPNEGLFMSDGLHLNERGYDSWSKIVRASLSDVFQHH